MNIVITCPRYFSEINKLENLLKEYQVSLESFSPTGQGFKSKEMKDCLQNATIAIVGDDEIDDFVIDNCKKLSLIIKWGVGVDNINISKDTPKVLNSPGDIYIDVAEHAVYLIGSLLKNIPNIHDKILNHDEWYKPTGNRLMNKNIGFVGYGKIAQQTSKLLNSFRVEQFFYDPYVENTENTIAQKKNINYLQQECDIIIVTTALSKETENLIDKKFFDHLTKAPLVVNVSRGQVINERDLIDALNNNKISGCELDVFETEPISSSNLLKNQKNVIFSTHNASNTHEANESVNSQVTDMILGWLNEQQ